MSDLELTVLLARIARYCGRIARTAGYPDLEEAVNVGQVAAMVYLTTAGERVSEPLLFTVAKRRLLDWIETENRRIYHEGRAAREYVWQNGMSPPVWGRRIQTHVEHHWRRRHRGLGRVLTDARDYARQHHRKLARRARCAAALKACEDFLRVSRITHC